jgi:lipopolysaccharide/colanic/teichoic acid biosynthesis glycosyltransferase
LPGTALARPSRWHLGMKQYSPPLALRANICARIGPRQRMVKRLLDLSLTSVLLLLAAPVALLVAFLIYLDDGRPIFFRQARIGESGRIFTMYKFRTMVTEAEKQELYKTRGDGSGKLIHKKADDPRITRLGRVLRRTSLDELPQFLNVLRGDMSLVGPRPEMPWLVAQYEPWQYVRLAVPQGITGLWQVNGRSSNPLHLSIGVDIEYIRNYSLWLDVMILLKTPLTVLRGTGAY